MCAKPIDLSTGRRPPFSGDSLEEQDDLKMVTAGVHAEQQCAAAPVIEPEAALLALPELPPQWAEQLPSFQHDWIRRTVFKPHPKTGKAELVGQPKLWWYPPQPPGIHTQPPSSPDVFFGRPLFLWMPLKMWAIPLVCVQTACRRHRLTAAGLYRTVRRVLDIDGWYDMATEFLECKRCRKQYPGWSEEILEQLDEGRRCQFPAVLTHRYSCDKRVVRMMRERTQGNSVTQLYNKLNEGHSEAWSERVLLYFAACEQFVSSDIAGRPVFSEPPSPHDIPKPKWLLSVYCRDVLSRLDEVKAKITSVFGSILKMSSTEQVTKKLAGAARNTAAICTNVGNEYGQVLCSVLTAAGGHGLRPMAAGLVKRYREAGVTPPVVMYVDRDCCGQHGQSQVAAMFPEWTELLVRLDIWHFMRRLAAGVTTDGHPFYSVFMARLSRCIFEWDPEDVAALRRAKQRELSADGMGSVSGEIVDKRISRKELALHCRRRTRGVEETTQLIQSLIDQMDSEGGKDTLGVPLLDHDRIQQIWLDQQRHITCIQDPPGFSLYLKTGSLKKGGVELRTYRCARGSTSLESFQLHQNRFIPGTSASDAHFQAYLLEGLMRWNEDRMNEALMEESTLWSYSSRQRDALNSLSQKVLGKSLVPSYRPRGAYTGEMLGVEYLYSQTGKALTVLDSPEEEDRLVEQMRDEQLQQDESFVEITTDYMTVPVLSDSSESVPAQSSSSLTEDIPVPVPASPQPSTSSQAEGVAVLPRPAPDAELSTAAKSSDAAQPSAPVLGPDVGAGWDKVQDLAAYLVSLREVSYLYEHQITEIIRLWTAVPEGDKKRLNYPPRYQVKLTQGHSGMTAGVVKRSLIRHPRGRTQWPSISRIVEAMCLKLCALHRSPTKKGAVGVPRWTKILRDYHHVRQLVLDCPAVMGGTTLQLFALSQGTLFQWFRQRESAQESNVQPDMKKNPISTSCTPSSFPVQNLRRTPASSGPQHEGQAPKLQLGSQPGGATAAAGPLQAPAQLLCPPAVQPKVVFVAPLRSPTVCGVLTTPATPSTFMMPIQMTVTPALSISVSQTAPVTPALSISVSQTAPLAAPNIPLPRSTIRNRKRRAEEQASGVSKRKYEREVFFNKCSKCGQPKTRNFGHSRYGNETFCAKTSGGKTIEQWLAEQRQKPPGPPS